MARTPATSERSTRLRFPGGRRGEAKRLIQQGGVKVNEEKIDFQDLDVSFDPPVLVQVGKRSFVELI
jgi:tyrosyl-tRNA synthetase